jgi:hypothetical protein
MLAFVYDHLLTLPRCLDQLLLKRIPTQEPDGTYKRRGTMTAAMAAAFTDRVWTSDELRGFPLLSKHLW